MRMPSRLVLLSVLLPGSLLLGAQVAAEAPDSHAHMDMPAKASSPGHASRWSDPKSWPDGGPLRYRVALTAELWQPGERPRLRQQVLEGDPGLAI